MLAMRLVWKQASPVTASTQNPDMMNSTIVQGSQGNAPCTVHVVYRKCTQQTTELLAAL